MRTSSYVSISISAISTEQYDIWTSNLVQWFNDVDSTDISDKCEDILAQLSRAHGCEVSFSLLLKYIVIKWLNEGMI